MLANGLTVEDCRSAIRIKANAVLERRIDHMLAMPRDVEHWSLTTLREKLVKIGANVTRHAKYVTFQLAEVAVPRRIFVAILDRVALLGIPPPSASGCQN